MNNKVKKKVYLLGAGGLAREIYSYLKATSYSYADYQFEGFLSDFDSDLDDFHLEHGIKGQIKTTSLGCDDAVIIGVSCGSLKRELFEYYEQLGVVILTYIHPTAIIGVNVSIGAGSIFGPYSVATANVSVGLSTTVNVMSTLGHDVTLGDFCTLSGHCDLTGRVKLQDNVFLGSRVSVIPGVEIGSDSKVGAGSVVIKNVKSKSSVFGNPAKKIK